MRNLFSMNLIYLIMIAAELAAIVFLCIWLPSYAPVAAVFALIWILILVAAVTVYCKGSAPEINCSIILMIIALPIAGAVIYLCSSLYKKDRGALKITGNNAVDGEEKRLKPFAAPAARAMKKQCI